MVVRNTARISRSLDADLTSAAALTDGHVRCVEQLEQVEAYVTTRAMYAARVGRHGVYLRPTSAGFTVLSLDYERCASMVGVGARDTTQHLLSALPSTDAFVAAACSGYEAKLSSLSRRSVEERFALELMSSAINGDLRLLGTSVYFIHQEWRFTSGRKLDLLAVDPIRGVLVVVELKASEQAARRLDAKKGGDAWAQANSCADELYAGRAALYPFFERLARALARAHGPQGELADVTLKVDEKPSTLVLWPDASLSRQQNASVK